jgi:hypothetical protein
MTFRNTSMPSTTPAPVIGFRFEHIILIAAVIIVGTTVTVLLKMFCKSCHKDEAKKPLQLHTFVDSPDSGRSDASDGRQQALLPRRAESQSAFAAEHPNVAARQAEIGGVAPGPDRADAYYANHAKLPRLTDEWMASLWNDPRHPITKETVAEYRAQRQAEEKDAEPAATIDYTVPDNVYTDQERRIRGASFAW